MSACQMCGGPAPLAHNYCGWECSVAHARSLGGKTIAPNGLPIRCIRADNTMLEHEHADHPDYRFPVEVKYVGDVRGMGDPGDDLVMYGRVLADDEWRDAQTQVHALIYTDGCIAVTLYEHCYAAWSLREGELVGGSLWKPGKWALDVNTVLGKLKDQAQERQDA